MKRLALFSVVIGGLALIGGSLLAASNTQTGQTVQTGEAIQVDARQALDTVTLKVGNMSCAACPTIVRRTLENVDGVVKAEVSYREKTAVVTYDPAKASAAQLTAATAKIGFPSTVIE